MKEAVTNAKKTHGEWDRKKRDLDGVVELSKGNGNTKGCKFEKDLEDAIKDGNKLDAQFLSLERKFNSKAQMAAANVMGSHLFEKSPAHPLHFLNARSQRAGGARAPPYILWKKYIKKNNYISGATRGGSPPMRC